jgi:hypothetical protein
MTYIPREGKHSHRFRSLIKVDFSINFYRKGSQTIIY